MSKKQATINSQKGIEKIIEWAKQEIKKGIFPEKGAYPDVSLLIETGKDCLIDRKYKSAIKYFDDALFLNPKNGSAWYHKGIAHYATGQGHDALKSFNKSIKYDCLNYSAIYYIGRLEQKLGFNENLSRFYKALDKKIDKIKKEIERTKKKFKIS